MCDSKLHVEMGMLCPVKPNTKKKNQTMPDIETVRIRIVILFPAMKDTFVGPQKCGVCSSASSNYIESITCFLP